jgi:transcription-repair coupling factor (superfamily II helicase)
MQTEILNMITPALETKQAGLVSGMAGTAKTYFLSQIAPFKQFLLCVVPTEEKAYDLDASLKALAPDLSFSLFLGRDFVFHKENTGVNEIARMECLRQLLLFPEQPRVIITTAAALIYKIISPVEMYKTRIELALKQIIPMSDVIHSFSNGGYSRVDTITRQGEFAVRGGIIDVFPPGEEWPWRIEFFGDEIDSLRSFDLDKQRSLYEHKKIVIFPADEIQPALPTASLFEYLPLQKTLLFIDEAAEFEHVFTRQQKRWQHYFNEIKKEKPDYPQLDLFSDQDIKNRLADFPRIYHNFFPGTVNEEGLAFYEHIQQQEMESFFRRYEVFLQRIKEWLAQGYKTYIYYHSAQFIKHLQEEFMGLEISGVEFVKSPLEKGFISHTFNIAVISENDIRGKQNLTRLDRAKKKMERVLIEDLKLGDYVVHENHGIGIFHGITRVTVDEVTREYILLQYAGTDKLYLPLDKLDLLHKYSSSEDKEPRLNKLGGSEWERTRRKVTESIQDMADDLLKLYAIRQKTEGYAFSPDSPWQTQFEDDFPYEETPGQLKAINDVKRDMESRKPMERLVCGDVGYGKTEVALRAAFKAILDGKQVAFMVPTTVLAEQHYQTIKKRFADYPANVEVLSRFRTAAQQKNIIKDLAAGVVDIVIATHRLLSKDVKFYDLGLLIIDEEHRFGVKQKEKLKALKEQVDVLSLSATPIPRSLHMALTGLRDLSVIDTPPPQRYPISTYVLEYNDEIIKEAIEYEIKRQGQVFFVHNRIKDIYLVQEKLQKLLPDCRIVVGHGRMTEKELAPAMLDFFAGKYDVFLCTTIIESGLDMPNVNTMIVNMADRMGLAQLYQLRGRIGRSDRMAYAYITYQPDKVITEDAQKRLNAIREFNELGAGMKIALRDLEIRGAGNILGAEQHGHIHAVGFDLYCRMLEEETEKLKGHPHPRQANTQLDIDIDYYIPESYIPDTGTRMRIYRHLLLAEEEEEIQDLKKEMLDRFGNTPTPVTNFLNLAELRVKARNKSIKILRRKGHEIYIQTEQPINIKKINSQEIKKFDEHTLVLKFKKNPDIKTLEGLLDIIQ